MKQVQSSEAEAWQAKVRRVDVSLRAMLAEHEAEKKPVKPEVKKPSRLGTLMFRKGLSPQSQH